MLNIILLFIKLNVLLCKILTYWGAAYLQFLDPADFLYSLNVHPSLYTPSLPVTKAVEFLRTRLRKIVSTSPNRNRKHPLYSRWILRDTRCACQEKRLSNRAISLSKRFCFRAIRFRCDVLRLLGGCSGSTTSCHPVGGPEDRRNFGWRAGSLGVIDQFLENLQ